MGLPLKKEASHREIMRPFVAVGSLGNRMLLNTKLHIRSLHHDINSYNHSFTLIPLGITAQDCSPSRLMLSGRAGLWRARRWRTYWVARTDAAPADLAQEQIGGQLNG